MTSEHETSGTEYMRVSDITTTSIEDEVKKRDVPLPVLIIPGKFIHMLQVTTA